jgi:hypothetical protein
MSILSVIVYMRCKCIGAMNIVLWTKEWQTLEMYSFFCYFFIYSVYDV